MSPRRSLSPCVEPGCPELTARTRCGEHQRDVYREDRQRRGSTTERRLGADHQAIRAQVVRQETHCWVCGGPVDKTLPGTDPDGPTADHVIERTRGGVNQRWNYRLAHARCNSGRT